MYLTVRNSCLLILFLKLISEVTGTPPCSCTCRYVLLQQPKNGENITYFFVVDRVPLHVDEYRTRQSNNLFFIYLDRKANCPPTFRLYWQPACVLPALSCWLVPRGSTTRHPRISSMPRCGQCLWIRNLSNLTKTEKASHF